MPIIHGMTLPEPGMDINDVQGKFPESTTHLQQAEIMLYIFKNLTNEDGFGYFYTKNDIDDVIDDPEIDFATAMWSERLPDILYDEDDEDGFVRDSQFFVGKYYDGDSDESDDDVFHIHCEVIEDGDKSYDVSSVTTVEATDENLISVFLLMSRSGMVYDAMEKQYI